MCFYRMVLVSCMVVYVSACSSVQFVSDENYRDELNKYLGKSVSVVVDAFGHADYVSQAPNGNKLYVYADSDTSKTPVTCRKDLSGNEKCTGGDIRTYQCKTFFEVDGGSVVVDTSFRGDGCGTCANKDALLCFRF